MNSRVHHGLLCCSILVAALLLTSMDDDRKQPLLPVRLIRMNDGSSRFQSQGNYHSAYLSLQPGGGFVYHTVYEVGYDIAIGDHAWSADTLVLHGDSLRTDAAVRDTSFYKKLFAHSYPRALQVDGIRYVQHGDTLFRYDHDHATPPLLHHPRRRRP